MTQHEVTNPRAWIERRKALLDKEKALMRAHDELAAARRALPWVRVEKSYWVSSGDSDFNYDFRVSFRDQERETGQAIYNYAPLGADEPSDMPGFSVFYKDAAGAVFHTYSTFGRGIEVANPTYQLLDLVPKGRDEAGLAHTMSWVQYHDEYPRGA